VPCASCDDTGWKPVVLDGVTKVVRCDCWRQQLYQSLLKSARVPRRYEHCEFANFETHTDSQRDAFRRATRIVDDFPTVDRGLLLFGDHGVGKTHLAVALMRETIRRKGARAVFYEVPDLLKLVRDTYNRQVETTELDVLRPVLEAELLVLDDLGRESKSVWVEETLGLVINTRYSERRLTVFTSNLADVDNTEPTSFAFQLGLRIRSRLKEMCDWVKVEGVDTREVGPHPSASEITSWQQTSPASPKNRGRGFPQKATGQIRAGLKAPREGKVDLKWPGGRAGS
jgi:DNA replication protein DnaC